ncbi:MAG: helix-turn-helix domain-containing protein [Ruminococcus flavefaciens]|nr:helix-turn-helix domain-containing protein [Ruminococcus flavefaciens]
MTLGNKVKERRRELRLTQTELAKKTSLTQTYLSMLERGRFEPTAPTIIRLAVALELSADELLGINDTKKAG